MADAGRRRGRDRGLRPLLPAARARRDRDDPRVARSSRSTWPSLADVDVADDAAAAALARHRGDQAQRRARHLDGHGPAKSLLERARRAVASSTSSPGRCSRLRERVRRPAAADLHEQLPHLRRHPGRRWPATRPRRSTGCRWTSCRTRSPSCAPTTSRPVDWHAGPRPRVVPARPRRPLHRAARHRAARPAHRRRATSGRSSPTPTTSAPSRPAGRRLVRRAPARRSRSRRSAVRRPTARAATSPAASRDGRIVLRETAQTLDRGPGRARRPRRGTGSSPPTTSGSTSVALRDELDRRDGVLGLPLIRNVKTVDPADPSTAPR